MFTQISNFIEICPVRAELFHADRWTDMTKLIVAFRNFANKNALAPAAIRKLDRPFHSPVAIQSTIRPIHFVNVYVIIIIITIMLMLSRVSEPFLPVLLKQRPSAPLRRPV